MKIERFLNWILDKLLNYPDIDFKTVKMFTQKFKSCLSKREYERWSIIVELIEEFSLQQITIDHSVNNIKTDNLEIELNNIKAEVKKHGKK